ncbi:hypothetical protein [Tenacibaculum sp. 190524A02b]|uniref:hypothetical protein n=1 Tax=Tenacibaculum vairaonense TaxID=3137860 RepID=UPI0031FAF2AA
MKKTTLTNLLFFLSMPLLYAQIAGGLNSIDGTPVTIPSPNAATLGTYGQVPVNLFNGLPSINIPLFKHENIDVNLSYHSSGIKPEHHSGWVGLGWNLNAGGAITRIVNGGVDEVLEPNFTDKEKFSYYSNHDVLDKNNWYNYTNMSYYFNSVNSLQIPYPNPDEFTFNFNGISGSFYYNHKGKWVVKSDQPLQLKIKEHLKTNFKLDVEIPLNCGNNLPQKNLKRIFYGFEITAPDGTIYIFGNTPNSIEFSLSNFERNEYNNNYVANTWFLTKIIKPNKEEVTFQYKRNNKPVFTQSIHSTLKYQKSGNNIDAYQKVKEYSLNQMFVVYLDKISFNQGEIVFNKSLSKELEYDLDLTNYILFEDTCLRAYFSKYKDFLHWYKLDNIIVNDLHGNRIKKFSLAYSQHKDSRLFLNNLFEYDKLNTNKKTHTFTYNTNPLPIYNSQKIDHWGYYNGVNFFDSPTPKTYKKEDYPDYFNSRQSNPDKMKAGILEKITYPTGGHTRFIYEPNDYTSKVEKSFGDHFNLINYTSNQLTGGLRIKEIISNSEPSTSPPVSKKYYYVKDFKNNNFKSSGVLAGTPNYMEEGPTSDGVIDYWFWNSFSIEPMALTNGNHITYSKVIEENADGSFTEHTFSNHNNEIYRDEGPNAVLIYNNEQWKYFPYNNKGLERGKLLSKKLYDNNKQLIQEIKNTYSTITDIDDNTVRALYLNSRMFFGRYSFQIPALNMAAFNIHKYYSYLSKRETINFPDNLKTTENYVHNNKRQLTSASLTNNKNQKLETTYTYVSDLVKPWPQPINNTPDRRAIQLMNIRNMINYPVEETQKIDGITSLSKLYQYDFYTGHIPNTNFLSNNINNSSISSLKKSSNESFIEAHFPQNLNKPFIKDPDYNEELTYHNYDDKSNPTEISTNKGIHIVYIWGYNKTQPIAQIENTTYNEVNQWLLETYNKSINDIQLLSDSDKDVTSENTLKTWLNKLRNMVYTKKPNTRVTTFTYDPLVGITSTTTPRGKTTYYTYDNFNRLEYIKDNQQHILRKNKYNYKN